MPLQFPSGRRPGFLPAALRVATSLMLVGLCASGSRAGDREPTARIYVEVHRTAAESVQAASAVHGIPGTGGLVVNHQPAFATLQAKPAHWNAEAGWDGWLATVQVFDVAGRPVRISGNAIIELTPRVPAADFTSFLALPDQRLRWTTLLATDEHGCATLKLPLRRSLVQPEGPWAGRPTPISGLLQVRVAVASEGVYEAEAVVAIRPLTPLDTVWRGGLVDTLWNGR